MFISQQKGWFLLYSKALSLEHSKHLCIYFKYDVCLLASLTWPWIKASTVIKLRSLTFGLKEYSLVGTLATSLRGLSCTSFFAGS